MADSEISYIFDQKYEEIKEECLRKKRLFKDPNFPANSASFYKDFDEMNPRIVHKWLRPGTIARSMGDILADQRLEGWELMKSSQSLVGELNWGSNNLVQFNAKKTQEIVEKPVLITDEVSRFKTNQKSNGGNRWLIAAVSKFAHLQVEENELFRYVIPEEQSFEKEYAGIFRFRFWQCGEWIEVVVDDRLPTLNGVIVSLSSDNPNEFWSALLEKAYAKLHGSYEALESGFGSEGFVDLTGSIAETFLRPYPTDFFEHLQDAFKNYSFIGCCYQSSKDSCKSESTEHYYVVTDVRRVPYEYLGERGEAQMLRVRNSWGDDGQWGGPGSDKSLEWNILPKVMKDNLKLNLENDGEFWISYPDFNKKFSRVEICEKPPNESDNKWGLKARHGFWNESQQKLVCCGKRTDQVSSLWINPQYFITVEKDDTRVIIDLIEKSRRKNCQPSQTLEYYVYSLCMNTQHAYKKYCKLDKDYLASKKHLLLHKSLNGRELSCSLTLDLGTYAIVPARENFEDNGEFYLRIAHDKDVKLQSFQ